MAAMIGVLLRKLERLGPLSDAERGVLEALPLDVRRVGAGRDLVREGDRPSNCLVLLEGFAHRYRALEDGRRQIMAFHVAGDMPDLTSLLTRRMDHGIAALTPVLVAPVPHATVLEWTERHPRLGRLLWQDTLLDGAIFREWVVNVGRRTAYQRVAHLLCELVTRLRALGLARDHGCDLPVTQVELADATGLSPVHVNRVLQELRGDGLIEPRGRVLVALDWEGLKRAGGFDPAYLQQLGAAA